MPLLTQRVKAQMAVEEHVAAIPVGLGYNKRLDNANLADRGRDAAVAPRIRDALRYRPQGKIASIGSWNTERSKEIRIDAAISCLRNAETLGEA